MVADANLAQADELWEICGEPVGLFSLKTRGETPSRETHRFLQLLSEDRSGSIASIIPPDLSVHVAKSDPNEVSDYFCRSGWVIVSQRFKQLVERFAVPNTEFFPLKVHTIAAGVDYAYGWRLGATLDNYWLMNCFNRVDTNEFVDIEASDLVWQESFVGHRPPWFRAWRKLVLKQPITEDLFGFADHLPIRRYVSRRFRDAAAAAGLRVGIYARPLQWPN